MTQRSYRVPPATEPPNAWRDIHTAFADLFDGRINSTGTVTLATGTTTTVLTNAKIHASSVILYMPTTSNAKGEGTPATACAVGSATLTHANAGTADRIYNYAIFG